MYTQEVFVGVYTFAALIPAATTQGSALAPGLQMIKHQLPTSQQQVVTAGRNPLNQNG